MFSRHRGAWGPEQRAALVVVSVLGALVLLLPDLPSSGPSRIEATETVTPRLFTGAPAPLTTADPPTLPEDAPATTAADGVDGAPATPSTSTSAASGQPAAGGTATDAGPAASTADAASTTTAPAAVAAATAGPAATSATTEVTTPAPQPAHAARTEDVVVTTSPTTAPPTTAAPVTARSAFTRLPSVEAEVVPLTNEDRSAAGFVALSRNGCLDAAASSFAQQLARSGVLAHNTGAGAAVRDCRPNAAWGDNVGTSNPCSASLLEQKWMASASHRRNILTAEFRYIGVGAWTDEKGACWVQVLFSS